MFKLPTTAFTPPAPGRNHWMVFIPHPLQGKPLTEQVTDESCDEYASKAAPDGWHLSHPTIQGRDRKGNRVLRAVYQRSNP